MKMNMKLMNKILFLIMFLSTLSFSKEFVTFEEFATLTNIKRENIDKCITLSSKRNSVPELIIKSIINVENAGYNPYAINCNTNVLKVSSSIKENYKRLITCGDNVDIGVMQINYRVWKKEYPNITTQRMLDPCINIELGTRILNSHYKETKDWITSIGYYHSRTPKHSNKYKKTNIAKILQEN